ncbi:MAG: thiamine ABC transporter substrate-binding protein [Candidatus Bipolaricaulota bacterium]|nr:thiamine ABC transporter substrate-binding protein [Candidatus Bipolaricaulota bacterium]
MLRRATLSVLLIGLVLALSVSFSLAQAGEGSKLVVYVYQSFVDFGPAKFIKTEFEKRFSGVEVEFVATGPSRAMLARLVTEFQAGRTPADLFLGEINDVPKAKKFGLFVPVSEPEIPNLKDVPQELLFDPEKTLIPYEHGYITLVYDSERLKPEELPKTFADLLKPQYQKKLIVQDARTSSVGYAFLLWTVYNYGGLGYLDYWRQLLPNILTIQPGWSAAYRLFRQGEAPMVVSFSTDAYFNARYKPLLPNNQGYRTVYGAGIVRTTDNPRLSREFLNFLLSPEVQEKLPDTEVMFPANSKARVPEKFAQLAIIPPNPVMLPLEMVAEQGDRWLEEWAKLIVTGR